MRWLVALALLGCGEEAPCNDAPLGGLEGLCTRIDGTWRLQASDARQRCGARLLSNPLKLRSRGSELSGTVDGTSLRGVNYASGAFVLSGRDGYFSLKGEHRVIDRQPVLIGSVVFGGAGQSCDALWDFTAQPE
jgi:hypothetical protein